MRSRSAMGLTGQWAIVLLTIAAWLFISNHCVLGLNETAAAPDSESSGCPMHSAPAKEKAPANLPCCKDLRVVAPHSAKNITAVASQLIGVKDYAAAVPLMPPRLTTPLLTLDTGPPHALSFAESILQRSILAHAPPAGFAHL